MKKVLWNVARLVIARLASLSAVGQSNPSVTFANIPFAFRVEPGATSSVIPTRRICELQTFAIGVFIFRSTAC